MSKKKDSQEQELWTDYKYDHKAIGKLAKGKFGGKAQYRLLVDSPQAGVEANYYTLLRAMEDREPFGRGLVEEDGMIIKTKDIFSSGETSAYWGSTEQKRSIQIDKFQQIMSNVGGMVKALFQLLRELRILEERLVYYDDSKEGSKDAEVHLKSVWIDQVEGGAKSPTSVIGLASQVGFASLVDLFFIVQAKGRKDIKKEVEKLKQSHGINRKVREVLGRKLEQYLVWKEKTYQELKVGQRFKLDYLRQHYGVIRLYLNWLRPYLKNVRRLGGQSNHLFDKDMVAAFDTSKVEIEFLAIRKRFWGGKEDGKAVQDFKQVFPVTRVRINFVAIPQIAYHDEGQRGAIHRGRTEIFIEGSVATKKDLEEYQKGLEDEDFDLIAMVDSSIMALREDLEKYLGEAGAFDTDILKKEEKEEEEKNSMFEPFIALKDFAKEITGIKFKEKKDGPSGGEKKAAEAMAKLDSYLCYYIFKKNNRMHTE